MLLPQIHVTVLTCTHAAVHISASIESMLKNPPRGFKLKVELRAKACRRLPKTHVCCSLWQVTTDCCDPMRVQPLAAAMLLYMEFVAVGTCLDQNLFELSMQSGKTTWVACEESSSWQSDMSWNDRISSNSICVELRTPASMGCSRLAPIQAQDQVFDLFLNGGSGGIAIDRNWFVCLGTKSSVQSAERCFCPDSHIQMDTFSAIGDSQHVKVYSGNILMFTSPLLSTASNREEVSLRI